jgi:3-hydroxyisobutyrate dehydrogenase
VAGLVLGVVCAGWKEDVRRKHAAEFRRLNPINGRGGLRKQLSAFAGALDPSLGPRAGAFSLFCRECDNFALMKSSRIGFVGVGRMGANMARRLHEIGHPVVAIYDANAAHAAQLAQELGAKAVEKVSEVSRLSDIVFTVVTDDAAMKAIFLGADNLFTEAKGKLFINCATISPEVHVEIEKKGGELGAEVLEAPMASSLTHAREGKLYMMVAGKEESFRRAEPLLKDLTLSLRYIGGPGKAAELKALVNMVMNINTAGLAEGLGLAEALGLDLKIVKEVFSQTGANSRVLETDGPDMLDREHSTFFSASHAAKDSGIALELAKQQGLYLPLLEASKRQYDQMIEVGLGEIDKSGISELTFKSRKAHLTKNRPDMEKGLHGEGGKTLP